jgi:aspartate kinase
MKPSLQVLKFGGTSVGSGERIRHVAHIIVNTVHNPAEALPVVVVSAMAKVTDQLLRIAGLIYDEEQEAAERELEALRQKHLEAMEKAVHQPQEREALRRDLEAAFALLEQDVASLRSYLASQKVRPTIRSASPYVAALAAWGERLSVLLVAAAVVDIGGKAVPVREEIIVTDQFHNELTTPPGVTLGADPLPEQTRRKAQALVMPLLEQRIVPVAAGFIGCTPDGIVTTLGRNGSDYSAAVIGAALDCEEVSIYTDVDGVLTADPRLVTNARLLTKLSYAEAARLSWFGAKVLHPRTLIPLVPSSIPVRVRNTFRPEMRGTLVGPEGRQHSGATAITVRRSLALITMESTELFGAPENAGQVFALAARAGAAPVAICSSAGHHLSFLVEEKAAASVVALLQDMGNWRVRSRGGLAACACIGSGFTVDPMSAARAITALARERIPVITQGASELGITLIVEDSDSERALRCLHRDLIAPVIPLVRQTHVKRRENSRSTL